MTQSTENAETRAWVLHPDIPATAHGRDAKLALAEAESLAHALPGLTVVGAELVRLPKPHPGTGDAMADMHPWPTYTARTHLRTLLSTACAVEQELCRTTRQ